MVRPTDRQPDGQAEAGGQIDRQTGSKQADRWEVAKDGQNYMPVHA